MPIVEAFVGGSKLKATLNRIVDAVGGKEELRVGFLEGSTEPDGTPTPLVAFWNEFGTTSKLGNQHIPPRPFFRNMVAAKKATWAGDVMKILPQVGFDATRTLLLMGERIKSQLQESIVNTNTPPLAPATIARRLAGGVAKRKGFNYTTATKPLIDTGTMYRNVDYEVSASST